MNTDIETEIRFHTFPLNDTLLKLNSEEEAFFKSETGIQDTEELRKHIVRVQQDAYKAYPYPCIFGFMFTNLKISGMPAYPRVLELGKNRLDAIFLDIGCCMGAEVRKIIHDGWPMSCAIATDLRPGFWDLGHRLFRTTPETYPVKFLAGDAFDDAHLSLTAPILSGSPPPVASANTLTELRGRISVIHASALFHLFNEEKQFELGKRLASLLDPRPGSIIFGSHGGMPVKGQRQPFVAEMFCHSPESWTQMWEEQIFEKGQVKVNVVLKDMTMLAKRFEEGVSVEERVSVEAGVSVEKGAMYYWLVWSVERL